MHSVDKVLILDFGSQFTQLIAKKVRKTGVYAEIMPWSVSFDRIQSFNPKAIILSGSPSSVNEVAAPYVQDEVLAMNIPIFGICYGQQALCQKLGGAVAVAEKKEFGKSDLKILKNSAIFEGVWNIGKDYTVWMSHGDHVTKLPDGFEVIGSSDNSPYAVIANEKNKIYGVQFHPEVEHTPQGEQLIENFLVKIAGCNQNWKMGNFLQNQIEYIRSITEGKKIVCAVSGGVDSSVVAALMSKAIGKNLYCIFVDNGLLRKGEAKEVINTLSSNFNLQLIHIDASNNFLTALRGVTDPEEKRKIIGKVFIDTFYSEINKIGDVQYLAQGTIYPDVIESMSACGGGTVIKSHHNVGGLPDNMYNLQLIEPLRLLFKDEVRLLAKELEISDVIANRHPFPGPGLAIRIVGEVTQEKCDLLREIDAIYIDELKSTCLYSTVWQAYAALLSVKSVGVMGDGRTYNNTCVLRAVTSSDGMSADFVHLPYEFLGKVARRIVNEVTGVNRVFYDITSKPPATIELE